MTTLDLIATGVCVLIVHAASRLWRNRETPGATTCLLFFAALLVYLAAVVHAAAWLPGTYLGYFAGTLIAPLLFVTVVDYGGARSTSWRWWRWILPLAIVALSAWNAFGPAAAGFAAIAAETGTAARFAAISRARLNGLSVTTMLSHGFVLATLAVALRHYRLDPAARGEMGLLAVLLALLLAVDAAHVYAGFQPLGINPTPIAIVVSLLVAVVQMPRSALFEALPAAHSLLLDSVKDAIVVVDRRRRIVDCNRMAEDLMERPRGALTGCPAADVLPREFAALLQSTVHLRSELAVRVDGTEAWFEVDVTPLRRNGRDVGHLVVARDISERRMVQNALEQSRRSLEAANARLREQSVTDPLTGLKNRRFLFQRLNEEMNRHHRSGQSMGLLVIDLDHFKAVNDTHGHPVGDEALIQVATTLSSTVRDCDVVARLGGEEFAVLAVNTDASGLINLAERVRTAIKGAPVARHTNAPMTLTASIGVAVAGPSSASPDGLFAEADRYLYEAKHSGRDRVMAAPALHSTAQNDPSTARKSAP